MSVPLAGANKELMMPRPTLKTDMSGFLQAFTPEVRTVGISVCIVSLLRRYRLTPFVKQILIQIQLFSRPL